MVNRIKDLIIKYKEIITYVIAGGLTTLVNYVVYTILSLCTNFGITTNNGFAWVAGVVFAFVINKLWVFESKSKQPKKVIKEFVSFVISRALTGVLEIFAPKWLVSLGLSQTIFGIKGMLAKLIVSIVVVILNYVFSKLIVFKKKSNK
jgi:putative flippase GtrA